MAVRIVTYDLNQEKKKRGDYVGLLDLIRTYPWARLSESSYAIETDQDAKTLYEQFTPHLDPNDFLLVLTLDQPWWGTQRPDVMEWLHLRL